jgi:hypothetical protein
MGFTFNLLMLLFKSLISLSILSIYEAISGENCFAKTSVEPTSFHLAIILLVAFSICDVKPSKLFTLPFVSNPLEKASFILPILSLKSVNKSLNSFYNVGGKSIFFSND